MWTYYGHVKHEDGLLPGTADPAGNKSVLRASRVCLGLSMSTLVLFRNPHSGEASLLRLLLLEKVGQVDEETLHSESRDQMHNEDRP